LVWSTIWPTVFAFGAVNHKSPSGPTATPNVPLLLGWGSDISVTVPAVVMWPIFEFS
jgi:hypothetical protein